MSMNNNNNNNSNNKDTLSSNNGKKRSYDASLFKDNVKKDLQKQEIYIAELQDLIWLKRDGIPSQQLYNKILGNLEMIEMLRGNAFFNLMLM